MWPVSAGSITLLQKAAGAADSARSIHLTELQTNQLPYLTPPQEIIFLLPTSYAARKLGYGADGKQDNPCHVHGSPSPLSAATADFKTNLVILHTHEKSQFKG